MGVKRFIILPSKVSNSSPEAFEGDFWILHTYPKFSSSMDYKI
jgi:hypothetical protein